MVRHNKEKREMRLFVAGGGKKENKKLVEGERREKLLRAGVA